MTLDAIYLIIGLILFGFLGVLIGGLIAKRTKILDNFSQESRKFNKVINNPEILIKKIEESAKKLNPESKGDLIIKDNKNIIKLGIKEENGRKLLDVKREKNPKAKAEEKRIKEKTVKSKNKKYK